jgi:hypothetical protein
LFGSLNQGDGDTSTLHGGVENHSEHVLKNLKLPSFNDKPGNLRNLVVEFTAYAKYNGFNEVLHAEEHGLLPCAEDMDIDSTISMGKQSLDIHNQNHIADLSKITF